MAFLFQRWHVVFIILFRRFHWALHFISTWKISVGQIFYNRILFAFFQPFQARLNRISPDSMMSKWYQNTKCLSFTHISARWFVNGDYKCIIWWWKSLWIFIQIEIIATFWSFTDFRRGVLKHAEKAEKCQISTAKIRKTGRWKLIIKVDLL